MTNDSTHFEELKLEDIVKKLTAFQESRILLTACELGVFDALHVYSRTAKEIAEELNANEKGMERLLDALVGLGFLNKSQHCYVNSSVSLDFLVKQSADYIGAVSHWNALWDVWSNLTNSVQNGFSKNQSFRVKNESAIRAFIAAMHWRAQQNAIELIAGIDLSKVFKIIDIGGGSGAYSFEFARAKPGLKSVVFDLPEVIPITQEYIEREKLSRKISTLEGDYLVDDFGSGYDLAFLSAVVHINSLEENFQLFEKIYDSLNRGGKVIVQDFTLNIERTEPSKASMFALNMFLNTENGNVYTNTEIIMMVKSALFSDVKSYNTPFGSTIFVGRK